MSLLDAFDEAPQPSMRAWALIYAARGWPVFPLTWPTTFGPKTGPDRASCSCGWSDCPNMGKHPLMPPAHRRGDPLRATCKGECGQQGHGLYDATTDPAVIEAWWRRWPRANIGLPTGIAFDVLDLDGPDAIDSLDAAGPPNCGAVLGPMVLTGRTMGVHIYVRPTGHGNRTAMLPGVDWRGAGGYVVAPPSVHHLGPVYEWSTLYGFELEPDAVPAWLGALVPKQPRPTARPNTSTAGPIPAVSTYGTRALEGELGRLALAPEGQRNHELNRSAFRCGQLIAGGELDLDTAARSLLEVALRIGLTEREADATIASGIKNGAASPRTAPPR